MLSFQMVTDERDTFFVNADPIDKTVIATEGIMWNMEVLFVENYTVHTIPFANIVPPSSGDSEGCNKETAAKL